ncbi:MAG: DUF2127 domain-containing protein [Steroidobacteraceae bacterium]|jgi:uncharacterized membrane protein (DUF2068 family)
MPDFETRAPSRLGILRVIALYKLGKVLLLLATAYGVLRMRDASLIARIYSWAATLPSGLEQDLVVRGLAFFSGLSPRRIQALGFVTLAYAALFAVEGVGLWLRRRWAEWLTTIITASLIPLEIWELFHRPGTGKAAVLIINCVIVGYLVWRLRADRIANVK